MLLQRVSGSGMNEWMAVTKDVFLQLSVSILSYHDSMTNTIFKPLPGAQRCIQYYK